MFKNIFKKNKKSANNDRGILIGALLIHAAKIDENYSENEKKIIKTALIELKLTEADKAEDLLRESEKKEQDSNQIIQFTKEIKKNSLEFRSKIIEILWKIVYSDNFSGEYESNLIRRICGLLYVSDKESGIIKLKVKKSLQ
tara:strand:- start:570 stop:995 length:426 start_codon:yes stop_codon:yes gene_type:complete